MTSGNPKDREETARRLVRRLMAEHSLSVAELARRLGRSRQRLESQLAEDGGASLKLSDLCLLEEALPGLLGEFARAVRLRVVPMDGCAERTHVVHAATSLLRATTEASAAAMDAVADGHVDRREAAGIRRACTAAQTTLAVLEAAVNAAEGGALQ